MSRLEHLVNFNALDSSNQDVEIGAILKAFAYQGNCVFLIAHFAGADHQEDCRFEVVHIFEPLPADGEALGVSDFYDLLLHRFDAQRDEGLTICPGNDIWSAQEAYENTIEIVLRTLQVDAQNHQTRTLV